MIGRLMEAGMNVARLNFSHGTHAEHERTINVIRQISGKRSHPVAILADLQGPKIRTGTLKDGRPVTLRTGQRFSITTMERIGDASSVGTTYESLPAEVHRGNRILLADGSIELRVLGTGSKVVSCRVINGGELGEHAGVNLPGVNLKVPALSAKDRRDLSFALGLDVSYVAVSFVRTAEDVKAAKRAIARAGRDVPVIAKLEKPEAIENLDAILQWADGVMVARGDLGVEMAPEKIPVVQKQIIARSSDFRLPAIIATQMLESMTERPRPTRAEASDVANAIFDGADAVMLSAETAIGHYPYESVAMMDRIIRQAEASAIGCARLHSPPRPDIPETISGAICHAAEALQMRVIAVFTESGSTARLISRYHPRPPIVAFSPNPQTLLRLNLLWGVIPRPIRPVKDIDALANLAERRLMEEGFVRPGEVVGIIAGTPLGTKGATNFLKLHRIGERGR